MNTEGHGTGENDEKRRVADLWTPHAGLWPDGLIRVYPRLSVSPFRNFQVRAVDHKEQGGKPPWPRSKT